MRDRTWLVALVALLPWLDGGCGPSVVGVDAGGDCTSASSGLVSGATTGTDRGSTTTRGSGDAGDHDDTTGEPPTGTDDDGDASSSDTTSSDLPPPPCLRCSFECSLAERDCPRGEKCTPWADDGASIWNALRCVPLAATTVPVGSACEATRQRSILDDDEYLVGQDNCVAGATCVGVSVEAPAGRCQPLCGGGANDPSCDPSRSCVSYNNEDFGVCLVQCDPSSPACMPDEVCSPWDDHFVCAPQTANAGLGQPCNLVNACTAGSTYTGDAADCMVDRCCDVQ